ncbi:MAG: nuclear transport factor 2 family protein [Bacteroidetes bacterium]|nr:nuclear transport factor 2 family protein [Bacteroidota bacterium]MBS1633459.1 nuclear transport factor 2 family protein [Bacteroidota bacterium]
MKLTKTEAFYKFNLWLTAWNMHNLDGVMALMHEDIVFENWDGRIVKGREMLRKAWMPWFFRHDDFKFITEELFFDEQEQKMVFQWWLKWLPSENNLNRQTEIRKGVDILHFKEGRIFRKITYSITPLRSESSFVKIPAAEQSHRFR